ncbi:MBL fold metallo-hydrolase [Actinomadura roseirufa]|uniref:MBL fold metallo-hydrolase n=1 Tax=Actinomadura roseirufa TaxID=2094049 RepID=UPI001040F4EB|nr:MBL fold metallo-hydrolase [Actinomadura roseirufa]
MDVEIIETVELGDRSYVAHDGGLAVVVDPQHDLDRVRRVLDERNLRCALVLETHVHNDYVSGGLELARTTGALYAVTAAEPVAFDRRPVADGDELRAGDLRVRVVATPGHTDTHLAYVVGHGAGETAVFTGGSLLYGSVGRTDLVDPARTEELSRAQFRSARLLADLCEDDARVYPTHGFGSFCSSGSIAGGGSVATIGRERRRNDALTEPDEDAFVRRLVAGLTAYPRYYAHMGARNLAGAGPADLSPPSPVTPDGLAERIIDGEWVVDLRDRTAYAAEHVAGTVGVELGRDFSTYLGWLLPSGVPLTLVGDSARQVADAQRQLVRIGVDRPAGAAVGAPADLAAADRLRSYRTATFAEIPAGATVLDVRRDDERAAGALPDSTHIPLHALEDRMAEVPPGRIWVHCMSGFRASIAASLLDRAGRDVILIDDDFPT